MDTKSETNIEINKENVKVKITERARGRMKINIKLAADEAEALKNFYLAVNGLEPDKFNDLNFTEFCKSALFLGVSTIQNQIMAKMNESLANNPDAQAEFNKKMEELNSDLESRLDVSVPDDLDVSLPNEEQNPDPEYTE